MEEKELTDAELAETVRRKQRDIKNYQRERGEPRPSRDTLVGLARRGKQKKKSYKKNKRTFPEGEWLPITNEFIEAMSRQYLRPNESKVLWFLIRKTWGWEKDWDFIPLKQFEKGLGIAKDKASRALSSLKKRRIVAQLGNKTYTIQSDTSLWRDRPKKKRKKLERK
ncbi:hypothetical protein ES703_11201 [subsurface metagenome]